MRAFSTAGQGSATMVGVTPLIRPSPAFVARLVGTVFSEGGFGGEFGEGFRRERRELQEHRGDARLSEIARFEGAGGDVEAGQASRQVVGGKGAVGESQSAGD